MAEINNRKRKLSSEECQENASKKKTLNENDPVTNDDNPDLDTTPTTINKSENIQTIPKSAIKSLSRLIPRNVVGTIGRKTSLFTRRTLRSRRSSLQTYNQSNNWDTMSTLEDKDNNSQGETTQKRNQTLHKYYTLKLRKLKEKFKTKRQIRKERFRSMQSLPQDRFRKDLNQSKVESNKQTKLLEKLLEKHNKHLESL